MDLMNLLTLYASRNQKVPTEHVVSGLAASFTTNMQSNLTAYEIEIAPTQQGEGKPSPENVRNILGIEGGITICRAGKNIYDQTTYPLTQDHWVHGATGTAGTMTGCACTLDFVPCDNIAGQTITINKRPNGNNPGIAFYSDANKESFISGVKNNGETAGTPWTVNVPYNAKYMRFTVASNETDIQIELGSTSTTYEPFVSITEYSVVFSSPSDVFYAGTLNVLTGMLSVTHGSHTFTGSESDGFMYNETKTSAGTTRHIFNTKFFDNYAARNNGSMFKVSTASRTVDSGSSDVLAFYNGTPSWQFGFYIKSTECEANVESFNAWLAEHPCQVVFPLAVIRNVQLDPVTVQTLLGSNTIWNNKAMTNNVTYLNKE